MPSLPSLVDRVREKSFRTHINWSTTCGPIFNHCIDQNRLKNTELEVDDLSLTSATGSTIPRSAKVARMTTTSTKNKNDLSPSFGDSIRKTDGSNSDLHFFRRSVQELNSSFRNTQNNARNECAPSTCSIDSNNAGSNSTNQSSDENLYYPYDISEPSLSFEPIISESSSNASGRDESYSSLLTASSSSSTNRSNTESRYATYFSKDGTSLSSYDNSLQLNEQMKTMVNCISCMSKEQLKHTLNMIREVVRNNDESISLSEKIYASDIHLPLSNTLPQNVVKSTITGTAVKSEVEKQPFFGTFQTPKAKPNNELPVSFSQNSYRYISRLVQSQPSLSQSKGSKIPRLWSASHENDNTRELQAQNNHTTAAVSRSMNASFMWNGELPKRSFDGPLSNKVFIGGLPYEATEEMLISSFSPFGNLLVEWPGKCRNEQPRGYAYVIFESELQVKFLLKSCRDYDGNMYYAIPFRKSKLKKVQVIPWSILDSFYIPTGIFLKLDPRKTVYVGALHGTMNAEALFRFMDKLFGGVIHAGICVDKYKYPTGSGRVTFNNYKSYVTAVTAAFVTIKTSKFEKKVQIDPFLEDSPCSMCWVQPGPYFCREKGCFRYFCDSCWKSYHQLLPLRVPHKSLIRNSKSGSPLAHTPTDFPCSVHSY